MATQNETLEHATPYRNTPLSTTVGVVQAAPLYVNAFPWLSVAMQKFTVEQATAVTKLSVESMVVGPDQPVALYVMTAFPSAAMQRTSLAHDTLSVSLGTGVGSDQLVPLYSLASPADIPPPI